MDATRVWRLDGTVRHYAWGSHTAIPALLGRPPDGRPQAELWLGAHPGAPSLVLTDSGPVSLDVWIAQDPEAVLGRDVARRFGGELPFLLKLLAADAPLSIQAHPDREQARSGFERENAAGIPLDAPERSYRDANPKPELICALTPFRAMNRFREPADVAARIAALGLPELERLLAPLREEPGPRGLASFFGAWMKLAPDRRARVVDAAAAAARTREDDGANAEVCRLAKIHPGDPGVLAPLFLNLVELAPGEAMYLAAGELHAYLGGLAVEIMASSDNVLRGGLTLKHVDVPELLETLTFVSGPVERLRPRFVDAMESRYETPAEEFALSVLELEETGRESPPRRGPDILLCTRGCVRVVDARERALQLVRGQCAVVAAAVGVYRVHGAGTLYRASTGFGRTDR